MIVVVIDVAEDKHGTTIDVTAGWGARFGWRRHWMSSEFCTCKVWLVSNREHIEDSSVLSCCYKASRGDMADVCGRSGGIEGDRRVTICR